MMNKTFLVVAALALCACGAPEPDLDELAREYLYLELSMGLHDEAHVDAYFGPEALRTAAEGTALTLDQILTASRDLASRLASMDADGDPQLTARIDALLARLHALDTRVAINQGDYLDFDDETMALFGARAPQYDAAHFQNILDQIDALLPGDGPLAKRVEMFNDQFVIELEKLPAVFEAAMAECRRRTKQHIDLPEGESFTIE